ncbi:hypothetical protein [Niveispirillum cyanobacteriorum]|uniref:hypothetical protein n=1 Tax=Niveispirillum cyanobacteriorum TaxID=1612173 RepID=UPI00131A1696|nr:hypothetical protein [Niveispirillum cyanobacteriorum]
MRKNDFGRGVNFGNHITFPMVTGYHKNAYILMPYSHWGFLVSGTKLPGSHYKTGTAGARPILSLAPTVPFRQAGKAFPTMTRRTLKASQRLPDASSCETIMTAGIILKRNTGTLGRLPRLGTFP